MLHNVIWISFSATWYLMFEECCSTVNLMWVVVLYLKWNNWWAMPLLLQLKLFTFDFWHHREFFEIFLPSDSGKVVVLEILVLTVFISRFQNYQVWIKKHVSERWLYVWALAVFFCCPSVYGWSNLYVSFYFFVSLSLIVPLSV